MDPILEEIDLTRKDMGLPHGQLTQEQAAMADRIIENLAPLKQSPVLLDLDREVINHIEEESAERTEDVMANYHRKRGREEHGRDESVGPDASRPHRDDKRDSSWSQPSWSDSQSSWPTSWRDRREYQTPSSSSWQGPTYRGSEWRYPSNYVPPRPSSGSSSSRYGGAYSAPRPRPSQRYDANYEDVRITDDQARASSSTGRRSRTPDRHQTYYDRR